MLEWAGRDRGLEEGTHLRLGVGVLRAQIPGGVAVRLRHTDDVDVAVVSRLEEVLSLQVVRTRGRDGVKGGAHRALGEEFTRRQHALRIRLRGRGVGALHSIHRHLVATEGMRRTQRRTRL